MHASQIPFFVAIFIIAAWEIWIVRNKKIFGNESVSVQLWTVKFKAQVLRQLHRVAEDDRPVVFQWLENTL
jgi:hypothetical protein